jgi:halimadienyl-diphosphate synthase
MNTIINDLIENIGPGMMPSTAYDTAWAARLSNVEPSIAEGALNWLNTHQLPDGSWGAEHPINYYDRVISTLSAMIALTKHDPIQSKSQVERGVKALENIVSGVTKDVLDDSNKVTIGFEMIIPTLVAEAEHLGIIKQQGDKILKSLGDLRKLKLSKIKGNLINRNTTMAFSAEIAGEDGLHMLDIENLQESNGSIGHSPSATAFYALYVNPNNKRAFDYLAKNVKADGGFPNVASFDAFEISWTLWNLRMIPGFEATPRVNTLLDTLSNAWQPNLGIGFATEYSVKDSDMTSLVFDTLSQYGYKKDVESILAYEEEDYFKCYPLEANPSISANIHVVGALRQAGYESGHPSVQKALGFLKRVKGNSHFWLDKWHSSPYYTTCHAIIACAGYDNELVSDSVDWLLSTQHANGAWGTYMPTAEETAYAMQALWVWNQSSSKIESKVLKKGVEWLEAHAHEPYQPLWIGKCLYSPHIVIRSAVASALTLGKEI